MHRFYKILKKNHLFDDLTADDMKDMNECFSPEILNFKKGNLIFSEGEVFKNIAIIAAGTVNIFKEDRDGRRIIIEQAGPGAVLDESISVKKNYLTSGGAEASVDSTVIAIPFERLVKVCERNCPFHVKLLANIVRLIASNHNALTLRVDYLSKKSVRHKLLSFLRSEMEKYRDNEFKITFDRKELAEFLFVDRSALSRELGRMRKENIIRFHKNYFKIIELPDN